MERKKAVTHVIIPVMLVTTAIAVITGNLVNITYGAAFSFMFYMVNRDKEDEKLEESKWALITLILLQFISFGFS